MPRTCSVCKDSRREQIDFALHRGEKTRLVSERFGLTYPTIKGHRRSEHHLAGRTPPRRTSSHTAASLLRRISGCLRDDEAMRDLRLAVPLLPYSERVILIEELRRRALGVEVGALGRVA